MHDGCFGLTRRPFASVPNVDNYFPGTGIENARMALARCIQRGEGTGLVMGSSGTGKTMLCLMLAMQFQQSARVLMLPGGRLGTRRALFQAILYELGRPYRGMDEGELRLAIVDELMNAVVRPCGLVLLVDEGHMLPLRLLEELRLLTNLARDGQPLVRLVLFGGSILEERFASPKLDSFNQRLAARCYLNALNRTETQQYIHHQISAADGDAGAMFSEASCQTVFQATGGVPRLINQVCDQAMLLAFVAGRQQVSSTDVEEAWADLQQLPTPWNGEAKSESTGGVIEFGALDDANDEAAPSSGTAAADASTPALRITPSLDDGEREFGAASHQIRRIEQLLAEADDDFQPAGSIVPEIELHFEEETPHPFQESFEYEELVNDRYAAASRSAATERRAARTAGFAGPGTQPDVLPLQTMKPEAIGGQDSAVEPAAAEAANPAPALKAAEESDAPAAVDESALNSASQGSVADAADRASFQQHDMGPGAEESTTVTRKSDLPVDADYVRPPSKQAPMRPQEFRTLFARLRRG